MWLEGRLIETGEPARVELAGRTVGRIQALKGGTIPDQWIAPGLIDIQANGYAGHDVNAPDITPEGIEALVRALWQRGVTAICPTVITQSEDRICRSLRAIAEACERDPLVAHAIPCVHVEGPYISPEDGPRGAHPAEYIRPPSLDEYHRWQEAAGHRVGIVTLAPEHRDSCEYISAVSADGVIVAIGHTGANEGQIRAAVDAGARLSTHLGNGAHAQIQRHPNYIWEQLAEDRLMASLICDGNHLPPSVMKTMLRAKGIDRVILVSDAVAVAGLPPGIYDTAVGGRVELLPSGRLNLYGTPYLAGSVSSLPECVSNATRYGGLPLADAVRLASANPARILGLDVRERRGSVRTGAPADLTLFSVDPGTQEMQILATVVQGQVVYRQDGV